MNYQQALKLLLFLVGKSGEIKAFILKLREEYFTGDQPSTAAAITDEQILAVVNEFPELKAACAQFDDSVDDGDVTTAAAGPGLAILLMLAKEFLLDPKTIEKLLDLLD